MNIKQKLKFPESPEKDHYKSKVSNEESSYDGRGNQNKQTNVADRLGTCGS